MEVSNFLTFANVANWAISALVQAITTQAIQGLITWLLALSPATGLVKAIQAVIMVVQWLRRNGARIVGLLNTLIDGLKSLLGCNAESLLAGIVERALGQLIAPFLDAVANLLGLHDLPGTVAAAVYQLQDQVWGPFRSLLTAVVMRLQGALNALLMRLGLTEKSLTRPRSAGTGRQLLVAEDGTLKLQRSPAQPLIPLLVTAQQQHPMDMRYSTALTRAQQLQPRYTPIATRMQMQLMAAATNPNTPNPGPTSTMQTMQFDRNRRDLMGLEPTLDQAATAVVPLCLVNTGSCFAAGTLVGTVEGTCAIEQWQCGQRTLSYQAWERGGRAEPSALLIDPSFWRLVRLEMALAGGRGLR